jgi:integrase
VSQPNSDVLSPTIMGANSAIVNGKAPPRRRKNIELRPREYLEPSEVAMLSKAASQTGRHGHRDATIIVTIYRHGLRVGELVSLRWNQVNLEKGRLHVNRLKGGEPCVHPLRGLEIRALRKLKRDYPESPYVFVTERGGPLTTATVRKMVARAGNLAKIGLPIHPHMLRHSTGFYLANQGEDTRAIQDYLGHQNIQHTVRYTKLAGRRFEKFWQD